MYNNSDGYVLIDLTGVDITRTNQYLKDIYNRIITVIDTNKLAIVINAGNLTPMAAIVRKTLNYYVITTNLYIFTINTNDIIVIEEAGEATVEVSIVPTLLSGVKVADYTIGATEGSIYVPEQQSEINDNVTGNNTTWSSDKLSTELATKANTASLATVATTGDYDDLTDKPTIPTKTSDLTNDSGFITSAQVPTIDDNTVASDKVWSSYKTSAEIGTKANTSDVYTKTEVDTALSAKANKSDVEYQVGDTITASVYKHCAGRTTNAGDKVLFFYPTAKPIGGNCSGASLVIPNSSSQCYTSAGGLYLKGGTYAGTITDGGLYFLVDLVSSFTDGGRVATAELQSRTITFS